MIYYLILYYIKTIVQILFFLGIFKTYTCNYYNIKLIIKKLLPTYNTNTFELN